MINMDYKISTITMSIKIPDCSLNLVNIGKYMKIDDDIIGIKYNFGTCCSNSILKGKYSTCTYNKSKLKNHTKISKKLFYNQVSIIMNVRDNIINVKLFNNGTLHLTGVKDINNAKLVVILLYQKLLQLVDKNDLILLTLDSNGIYIDSNNNIYSKSNNKVIIGYKYSESNLTLYNIHKKDYIYNKGTFILNKFESKRTKSILNLDGNKIGYSKIELLKNKSKLYKNNLNVNIDTNSNLIYYDSIINSQVIGKIIYNYFVINNDTKNINNDTKNINPNTIEYNYSCNPFINNYLLISEMKQLTEKQLSLDVNCINIYFKFDFELNRQRLFNKLHENMYTCEYKPEKYSGVKLRYKTVSNGSNDIKGNKYGICNCNNKCICNNSTFLIFQSGNVIAMGFKSISEIQIILDNFNLLINSVKKDIKKKIL